LAGNPDREARYAAVLEITGTARQKLGHIFKFFMEEGVRPFDHPLADAGRSWKPIEVARKIEKSAQYVGMMANGKRLPNIDYVLKPFLGYSADKDTPERRTWRNDVRKLLQQANGERADGTPKRATRTDVAPDRTKRRVPILYWRPADSDRRRNECLDDEPAPVDLYVSVGAFANAGSQITLRMNMHPGDSLNIKSVTLVRLSPQLVQALVKPGLLAANFEEALSAHIQSFIADIAQDPRNLPIYVRQWKYMPSFHGYLFGNRRFTNQWGFQNGKLHVDIPLLEYPSPDWNKENRAAVKEMDSCELIATYIKGKKSKR
jgi:hypothetical protein